MVQADPSPGKVIMDIGCNKGNDAIKWMELWDMSPGHFWSTKKWIDYLQNTLHGVTYACAATTPRVLASQVQPSSANVTTQVPTGVCVEPMRSNVDLLRKASATLGYGTKTPFGSFHIVHAVVEDSIGPNKTVDFPDAPAGSENQHVSLSRTRSPV